VFGKSKFKPARTVQLTQDATGAPAVDLNKAASAGHVDLVKRAQKAGISLSKRNLAGIRAQAVMVLDHSGSMFSDYRSGAVQTLVERALGFAMQIDIDGEVPVIAFDSRVWPSVAVGVDNYQGVVDRDVWRRDEMGSTDLASALREVQALADKTDAPMFVLVITDGAPNNRTETTKVVCDLAGYPAFIKFLAIQEDARGYLQKLDDLSDKDRLIDNVDAKFISDPAGMSDLAFADAMVDEWDSWIEAAVRAGVLTR
jgi:hypothetical protein